jgi:predicted PurR-regulated permease PerM
MPDAADPDAAPPEASPAAERAAADAPPSNGTASPSSEVRHGETRPDETPHGGRASFGRRALLASAALVAAALAGYLLLTLSSVLLVLFAGVLLAVALHGASQAASRATGLPRQAALVLLVGGAVGLGAGLALLAPTSLGAQLAVLTEQIPEAWQRIRAALRASPLGALLAADALGRDGGLAPDDLSAYLGGVVGAFSTTLGGLTNVAIIAIVGLYGAAWPAPYTRGVLTLVGPARRARARYVLFALARALRWWVVGRLTSMAILGTLTALGLWALGLEAALLLGLGAGLLSFVPYLGPLLSAVPALLAAVLDPGVSVASVALLYAGIQFAESYLITPLVQRRAVSIPPAALVAAQAVVGALAGVLGVLLATPLAVATIVLVQTLYVEGHRGGDVHVLGEHPGRGG